ncbi:hypothetical protein LTR17_010461 [Elasticomyces elasticus]|nr:hypothetical protein LTR17_010461 [Elasticomyces elasticus]
MAASKTKSAPTGSAPWIQSEREQAARMIDEEAEEFQYGVRNELEWLNEHMGEVFSQANVTFADIFKTPGKLRGKTPRTARKRDAGQASRQPLTDIFAPNANTQLAAPTTARKNNAFYDKVAQFQIAEDQGNDEPEHRPISRSRSPQRVGKPGNTDSGYHGMTEDEMDADAKTETATASSQETEGQKVPLRTEDDARQPLTRLAAAEAGRVSDESFMSAKEEIGSRNASRAQLRDEPEAEEEDIEMHDETAPVDEPVIEETPAAATAREAEDVEIMEDDVVDDTPHTLSDEASTPGKPLQRKSSFTFSALPAREPLTAKRSMGVRDSQIDTARNSVLARSFGTKDAGVAPEQNDDETFEPEQAEETLVHSKTTTQLLQERISMLGQIKEPRMSKSIAHNVLGAPATYPKLPPADAEPEDTIDAAVSAKEDVDMEVEAEDEDDDWIAPSKPAQAAQGKAVAQPALLSQTPEGSPRRPVMHQKSISTTQMPSPTRPAIPTGHQKAQSVSHPNLANAAGLMSSTTPMGSPAGKKHHDGPLSASKSRLWSALKTAKNIFASSASASAAAKLEAHNSPAPNRSPKREFSDESKTTAVFNMPGAMYSASTISTSPSRKTRSSNESDKKKEKEMKAQLKAQQKADAELEKAREKERVKALKQQEEKRKFDEAEAAKRGKEERRRAEEAQADEAKRQKMQAERPMSAGSDQNEMAPPPPPKSLLPAGKLRAPAARPGKPTRGAAESASRPALNIRVTSQSQRLGQQAPANATLSRSRDESMPPPPPPPKTGLRTASAQGNVRGSVAPAAGNARGVRALEAAAKKREADEKAAAKKAEQKRELERKRAAKVEEERRVEEERKAAEQARVQEARLAAQRKTEAEAAKRKEILRQQQQHQEAEDKRRAREAHELNERIARERAPPQQHPRGDVGGTLRQLGKNTVPGPQANGGRPAAAKRVFQAEEEEEPQPQRPGMQRGPPSYQQHDAKRRRTNEEDEPERHSVMAPPKRPSNMMRKESTQNKFPHGYTHAPPPAAHHVAGGSNSMFKSTVTAQHHMQHAQGKQMPSHPSQTVQMSNARIPFAENANPPAAPQHPSYQQHMYLGHENTHPAGSNKFKTPGRPAQAPKGAKSSPLYPNGDAIQLPEIMTDSEDESDDEDGAGGGFRAPSWVASPALRDLLTQQQLVDPETVFGPIGELKMEEVFKGGKNDRMKRFRDRGSSAAWLETGDAVTSAEKRRDMEARERVVRDGGWRFEPTT